MTENVNRQVQLAARPTGLPKDSDWNLVEETVSKPGPGQVLVRNRFLSIDPAMRGWMNDRKSYVPPLQIGAVMRSLTVGEVVASENTKFAAGDAVAGLGGVQTFALGDGKDLQKIDLSLAPYPVWLDTLGIAGLTAYCGLLEVGEPKAGDIVLVSTKNVFAPGAEFGAYSATKAAGHQLARIASQEFAGDDVRVNMVAPDAVFSHGERPSGLWAEVGPERMLARGLDADGLEAYYRDRNLLKARITAKHVGSAVLFFLTRSTPTTGVTLPVDGGLPDATPR